MYRDFRCQALSAATTTSIFIIVPQVHAFIAFPPITTFSLATVFLNFWIFALSFSCSVMFQGWFMKRRLGIEFIKTITQAFKVKIIFIAYALPLLVLSDVLGTATISAFEKLDFLYFLQDNLWFKGIAYFMAGLLVLTSVSNFVETHMLSKEWKDVPLRRLRSTIAITNVIIFAFALLTMVVLKEIRT